MKKINCVVPIRAVTEWCIGKDGIVRLHKIILLCQYPVVFGSVSGCMKSYDIETILLVYL